MALAACGRKVQVPPPVSASPPAAPGPASPVPQPPDPAPVVIAVPAPAPPVTPGQPPAPAPAVVSRTLLPGPPIRIGLRTSAAEVRITSPGEYFIQEKAPEAARRAIQGEIHVRIESRTAAVAEIYRVQVASLSRPDAAETLSRDLSRRFSQPGNVRSVPETGMHQVRLGEFRARDDARAFASGPLADAGYRDAFVVQDTVERTGGSTITLRGPDQLLMVSSSGFFVFPSFATEFLRLDGKPYRGLFDLALNRSGRLTLVNQLGMEEYLLGVVPAEISPTTYPEPAALAAQAVAARTYALKNRGRFRSEGFDLTDDERTQVYGGVAAEKEATNEAVRSTYGVAVYHQGNLIEAMYSSTCGGRTEDFSLVYGSAPVPYLVSVICAVESETADGAQANLRGAPGLGRIVFADGGRVVNRELELAQALGLAGPSDLQASSLEGTPDPNEIRAWLRKAQALGKRPGTVPQAGYNTGTRAGFIRFAAEGFFGAREIGLRISPADAAYYLANLRDGSAVAEGERTALAYVMQQGAWHAYPDNTIRPSEPITRADALTLLVRWVEAARPDLLSRAVLVSAAAGQPAGSAPGITVKQGSRTESFVLADSLSLFRLAEARSTPVEALKVIGNERLSFLLDDDRRIRFLEVQLNPTGAASDRYSPVATWSTTIPRQAAGEKLRPLAGSIGDLLDLQPETFGNSGRVVQIRALGTRGSLVLNGYRVRGALGLRDTLFTIKRTLQADGRVDSFTFDGRGFGHGIGLCQVGAFGMARAGRTYEEILKAYYTGVELAKAYQ